MKQLINYIISELQGFYPDEELRELAYWIIEETTGMNRTQILIGDKGTTKNAHLQEKLLNVQIQSNFESKWAALSESSFGGMRSCAGGVRRYNNFDQCEGIARTGEQEKLLNVQIQSNFESKWAALSESSFGGMRSCAGGVRRYNNFDQCEGIARTGEQEKLLNVQIQSNFESKWAALSESSFGGMRSCAGGVRRYNNFDQCEGIARTDEQEKLLNVLEIILQKLRAKEPIQYIFGHTEWKGLDLRVTPATLIPRPETAELVDWVLATCDTKKPLHVLDIGTGSGCIAIALKKSAPLWHVTGVDISSEALAVARDNAERNQVEVNWLQADVLSPIANSQLPIADIIISNPPYICDSEKAEMDARVLDYEPHTALFVPDHDPLLFYRRIASLPPRLLASSPMTHLFFEINEAYGNEVCEMMREMGYTNVELKHDMYGKPRMVFGAINC